MRLPLLLPLAALLAAPLALAADAAKWSALAAKSKGGVLKLDSASYDELLAADREYSVAIVLTALPAQFKCQPCQEFDPLWHQIADSWKRQPRDVRDQHFFAQLDFPDGQPIYQRLGLTTAPTVMFHPAQIGPNKGNKLDVVTYDLNRAGLNIAPLHGFLSNLTPAPFALHKPFNPLPFIVLPLLSLAAAGGVYSARALVVPVLQSRLVWGAASALAILTFTSGHMWNKIKGAPYVTVQNGKTAWMAGGYQNQLGLESQVVGTIYGTLAFCVIVLTLFVPAQSSPLKQRVGVFLWLGLLVVVFSILFRLFKMKNGAYPFGLLF
ncbi:oligosaccharyl transferase subunit ost3/OST6 [Cryptotrichosporon argae]